MNNLAMPEKRTYYRYSIIYLTLLFLFLLSIIFLPSPEAADGLRAHWKFDDGSGFVASDSTIDENDGFLVNGPMWTEGQLNGALEFDGQDDHVVVNAAPLEMNTWGGITVAAWVKNDIGPGAGTDDIVSWWNWDGYPCSDCSFVLTHHRNNQYFLEMSGTYISGGTVSTNWTYITATYDGSMMRLYINGGEVASASYSGGILYSTADLIIGGQTNGSNYFDGLIDEIKIYDSALTAQEVLDLFNSTTPEPDATPPTQPDNLTTLFVDFTTVEITWTASDDPESGVDHYNIYRDGNKISESTPTNLIDNNLLPGTTYTYEISAVNGQGLESIKSDPLDVTTLTDTTPPSILSVQASETSVVVEFDENLDAVSATDLTNYDINNGITIFDAVLGYDNKTVTLTTSSHQEGIVYDLSVNAVADFSGNAMPLSVVSYSVVLTDPELMAHWKLDDGVGSIASDSSGNGNDGILENGPVWTSGGISGALIFDGQNDQVIVDAAPLAMDTWSAISVGAWIKNDIGVGVETDDIVSYWNYPSSRSWVLTHHKNNKYFWEINGKGFVTGGAVSTDWTYVMGTYDGSTMRLYVNGVQVATAPHTGGIPFSTADLIVGGQANGSNFFDGIIDEVQIYNRALSAQEILDIYNSSGEPNTPPTVSASGSPLAGSVPLTVQFFANAQDEDGSIVSYYWDFGDYEVSNEQNPVHTYNFAGEFTAQVEVTDDQGATAIDTVSISAGSIPGGPAVIDVWYGLNQSFGNIGSAQVWANILGNVSDPDGIDTLSYKLNGGDPVNLSVGPDDRRLLMDGDFNLDIDLADLQDGSNSVQIMVSDLWDDVTTETVMVQFNSTNTWPLPYSIDWSNVTNIQDAVQVVDALWAITMDGIRIVEPGYDRVLAVGDLDWDDYEITVPITVHDFDPGPLPPYSVSTGFGISMRWSGHTDDPVICSQPHCGWLPSGANAWYDIGSGGPLLLDGNTDYAVTINVGDTYIWKMRVETIQGVGSLYFLKVWNDGHAEPSEWNIQKQRGLWDETNGSLVLNLHHVDATFGNLTVIPISTGSDNDPPIVESVRTSTETQVLVVFSEPVDPISSTDTDNYLIDNGIIISDASLGSDSKTVTLTTNEHIEGFTYTIDISGVTDQATPPNIMDPVSLQYIFLPLLPVTQYLFDEGDGLVAGDSSGNGYDGDLINGPMWIDDSQKGSVIGLDGMNDHIAVDSLPLGMDTWNEITVAAWVKNDVGIGAGTDDIVSWWRWTGYPCTDCSFMLTHHGNNQYFFQIGDGFISGSTVSTDWTFVVATYNGNMIRLYINGSEVASAPYSGAIPFSTADLIIGGQADGSNFFDGRINDVEIFDVALSAQEIISRYNNN